MKPQLLFILTFIFFSWTNAHAQDAGSLFLKREVQLGSETYGYRVYVPKDRDPKVKLPVMLYLHGNAVNGTDNEKQIAGWDKFIPANAKFFKFIIVFPQARPNSFWLGTQATQALKALDQTVAEFNGDPDRLYLSGHSLGGYGTWTIAAMHPQKFAALVPLAGGIVPPYTLPPAAKLLIPKELLDILNAADPYDALALKIGNTPVWAFHGAQDESVPVKESRNIVAALKKRGSRNVNYTEYASVNHNDVVFKAFSDSQLYKWLSKQKLKNAWSPKPPDIVIPS